MIKQSFPDPSVRDLIGSWTLTKYFDNVSLVSTLPTNTSLIVFKWIWNNQAKGKVVYICLALQVSIICRYPTYLSQLWKMSQPRPLFPLFSSSQTHVTILTTIKCEKCPSSIRCREKCPSSIRCRDSNSQPLEHESPPITTRPGLPPSPKSTLAQSFSYILALSILWKRIERGID